MSAKTGENVDRLCDRIHAELPDYQHERLVLPMTDETMSVVSWIHDNANVSDVDYGDQVVIEFEARPAVVEQSRARASDLAASV